MEPPQSPRDTNATDAYHARESIVSPIVEFTIPLVPTDENYLNDAWPVNKCSQIYIYIYITIRVIIVKEVGTLNAFNHSENLI